MSQVSESGSGISFVRDYNNGQSYAVVGLAAGGDAPLHRLRRPQRHLPRRAVTGRVVTVTGGSSRSPFAAAPPASTSSTAPASSAPTASTSAEAHHSSTTSSSSSQGWRLRARSRASSVYWSSGSRRRSRRHNRRSRRRTGRAGGAGLRACASTYLIRRERDGCAVSTSASSWRSSAIGSVPRFISGIASRGGARSLRRSLRAPRPRGRSRRAPARRCTAAIPS